MVWALPPAELDLMHCIVAGSFEALEMILGFTE
jgi:hypothetical protein